MALSPNRGGLAAQFKLKSSTWNALILRPSWEGSSFGVPIKRQPISILKPTGVTLPDRMAVTLETAKHYANNWSRMEMDLHGFAPSSGALLKPDTAR